MSAAVLRQADEEVNGRMKATRRHARIVEEFVRVDDTLNVGIASLFYGGKQVGSVGVG